jgi:hypothetical protein
MSEQHEIIQADPNQLNKSARKICNYSEINIDIPFNYKEDKFQVKFGGSQ